MKILHYFLIATAALLVSLDDPCGKSRWEIKILTDDAGKELSYKSHSASIKKLVSIRPSVSITDSTPRQIQERKTYTVTCFIREYTKQDDGGYRLVLVDTKDPSRTMIAEIPDPDCSELTDCPKLEEIAYTYNEFKVRFRMQGNKVLPGKYKVTGVFFFDTPHNQSGAAPNNAELHPVLSIKKID